MLTISLGLCRTWKPHQTSFLGRRASRLPHNFHTHRSILLFASPTFKDMFTFPSSGQDLMKDGKPIVPVFGESATLESCLFCASLSGAGFNSLDGVVKAYNAVDKFLIPDGQTLLQQIMASPKFLEKELHRVFAIACVLELEELAKEAAMETLRLPRFVSALSIPEFDLITARQLRQLEVFHATCSENTIARAERYTHMQPVGEQDGRFVWWTSQNHAQGCGYTYDTTVGDYVFPARWFSDHVAAAKNAANNIPAIQSVLKAVNEVSYANLETLLECPECRRDAKGSLSMMAHKMAYDLRMDYRRLVTRYYSWVYIFAIMKALRILTFDRDLRPHVIVIRFSEFYCSSITLKQEPHLCHPRLCRSPHPCRPLQLPSAMLMTLSPHSQTRTTPQT
ncbi:hypothetical protein R3P38DRAFT_988326 [Favolaschia claudopus]|uniref:BTB domain-containing protein n=1 Tax=Favolaschia claudopus TaxID=2862362 RepID=A0AAW0BKI1_9AGAR